MPVTKLFNIRIDENLHREFKTYCNQKGITMSDVILGHIQSVVEGEVKAKVVDRKKVKEMADPLAAIRGQYD